LYTDAIMDRCVIDGVVYTHWLWKEGKVEEWVFNYSLKVFNYYKDRYDYIFYLKPEFDIVDDGMRSTNTQFRDEIVGLFDTYIKQLNVPVIMLTGSVQERLEQFYNTVKNHG
jgi:nicotinamide riboside kinase